MVGFIEWQDLVTYRNYYTNQPVCSTRAGDWTSVWFLRDLWHFHFYGKTPLALVEGRERIYLEHFWNDFATDPARSVSEADRRFYEAAYTQPGAMRAGSRCIAPSSRTPRTPPASRGRNCRCWC
jgi:hypothetical protein